jgi:predicted dehydrogenase
MIKSVIIGVSGGRAHGLAEAYKHVKQGKLVAVSTRQQNNLDAFGDKFGVAARYTDYQEMLEKEQPDLIHLNTPPSVRLEIFEAAAQAGASAVLVEKPLAIQGEDYLEIKRFAEKAQVKIAINHQLHFHPRRQYLQHLVQDGAIGEIRFVEASAGMNLAYQGTHALQSIGAFSLGAKPVNVFGQISGAKGLVETPKHHYAPDQCVASINYDNGLSALLRCGENAPRVIDNPAVNVHKRIAVYGTKGFTQWTMHGWETNIDHVHTSGAHIYGEEDILGQAAMTEAMIDWITDDQAVHPLNINLALSDFSVILGIYQSALTHSVVNLPIDPQPDLLEKVRGILK